MDIDHHLKEQEPHKAAVEVVLVPLPAQGHLNPLIHLSRLISERGIPVHMVGSATHNRQAKNRLHGWDLSIISNVHFHDFPLPSFPTPPADPDASNKWPIHLLPTFEATINFREPLAQLLHSLSLTAKRVAVVHDSLMNFAAEEASSIPNGESYCFNSCSAIFTLFYQWESLGKPSNPYIESLNISSIKSIDQLSQDIVPDGFLKFILQQKEQSQFDAGKIYNTCRPIEGKFIDILGQQPFLEENKKQWAFGPLNPVAFHSNSMGRESSRHKCLEWLDAQPNSSVLYVSFGTMTSVSDKQIEEIAFGLEKCQQRFLWVLRDADRGDIYSNQDQVRRIELPEGYEERVKGVGMIVRDWAPQLGILAHPSTGGFLSHCGWNSCIESISMGVPIATWPMHSDQPSNALLVTEVLKIGVVVREWAHRGGVTSSTTIASPIRKLMASEEGKNMKKRAEKLGAAVRQAVSEGGTSTAELHAFLGHISRPQDIL
ncbi:zeatin O-glucosyltransferase-like [Papaver somniferum]|uniref:zeatin O-glucosyltransferase-like n=1 Tax=Papaver somniferum TaxID=3469 RepID=UPI000E6FBA61|nr:zeatin O-glucosyltransferase-like [Papaver somniferum]